MTGVRNVHSSYLDSVFNIDEFPLLVKETTKVAKRLRKELMFDGIAFCGVSGAAMAFPLSVELKLPLLCVRKPENLSHHYGEVEGDLGIRRYLVVDDFMSLGRTVENIIRKLKKFSVYAQPIGVLLYLTSNDWHGSKTFHIDDYTPSVTLPIFKSLPPSLTSRY